MRRDRSRRHNGRDEREAVCGARDVTEGQTRATAGGSRTEQPSRHRLRNPQGRALDGNHERRQVLALDDHQSGAGGSEQAAIVCGVQLPPEGDAPAVW